MLPQYRKSFRRYPDWIRISAIFAIIGLFAVLRTSIPGEITDPEPLKPLMLDNSTDDWSSEELSRNPNVIIVLSEAFWDPTLMTNLSFSRDPIPTFHQLSEKYTSGWMLSPQFGGGTANVELEVLTGHSMRFLPENSIAYDEFIDHDIESLASVLSRQNYTPTVIAPFFDWYFNSRNVYRHFGFSRYISYEFFNPNEFVGPYIGDYAVAKRIMEETARTAGPDFIFASTMENHYHYFSDKFERNTIRIKDTKGKMAEPAIDVLETYAQGARGADAMLRQLVEHYSRVKEPTIIVFFGDHLPYLEEDYYVYREGGYMKGEDDPDFLQKMYKVPLLVWNNYKPDKKESLYFNPSFLGPYILQLANLKGSDYTDFLQQQVKKTPIIPPASYYKAMNVKEEDLAEYKLRQQQMMFGSSGDDGDYWEEAALSHTNYTMGYGDPYISYAEVSTNVTGAGDGIVPDLNRTVSVSVKGGRYGIGTVVYAKGKPLQTTWHSEEGLTAIVPKQLFGKSGKLELQIRVVDEKQNVLAQSKPYSITLLGKATGK